MSFLDDLMDKKGIDKPDKKYTSLKLLLRKKTGCRNVDVPDRHLEPLTKDEVDEFLRIDQEDKEEYVFEGWDCDDFALAVFANAKAYFWGRYKKNGCFGMYRSPKHARCFFVDYSNNLFIIEPQTDEYVTLVNKPRLMIL